jgi:hypothetical protein
MKQDKFNQLKDLLKDNYDISFGLYLNAMSKLLRAKTSGDEIEQVRMLMSDINSLSHELNNLIERINQEASDDD